MSTGRFYKIVVWVVLLCLLVGMLVLAFSDAAETGEEPNVVGAVAAWVAITAVTWLFVWIRSLLTRGATKALDEVDKRLDG